MKKKALALFLCGAMIAALAGCTTTGSDEPKGSAPADPPKQSESAAPSPAVSTEPSAAPVVEPVALEASGTIGDYSAEIKDFVLTQDYAKNPAIVITYTFTNHSEDSTSAMISLNGSAYQNGVQLSTAMVIDKTIYNATNPTLDIKPGGSLDIQAAYTLISETAPVEFELRELISLSKDALGKTYEISPGGVTELATIDIPADAVTGKIDDFEVSIISMVKGKDYADKDCVTVTYGFKNTGTEVKSFSAACSDKAYQDSVQLQSAFVTDTSVGEVLDTLTNVKPGAAITVSSSYLLTSGSDVEIEVGAFFSLSDEKVVRTFTLG